MGNYKILQIMRKPVRLYIFLIHCYNNDSSKRSGNIIENSKTGAAKRYRDEPG